MSLEDKLKERYEKEGWKKLGISREYFLEHETAPSIPMVDPPDDLIEKTTETMHESSRKLRNLHKRYNPSGESFEVFANAFWESYKKNRQEGESYLAFLEKREDSLERLERGQEQMKLPEGFNLDEVAGLACGGSFNNRLIMNGVKYACGISDLKADVELADHIQKSESHPSGHVASFPCNDGSTLVISTYKADFSILDPFRNRYDAVVRRTNAEIDEYLEVKAPKRLYLLLKDICDTSV